MNAKLDTSLFRIEGKPATYETTGKTLWKKLIDENTPPPALDSQGTGLSLNFSVSYLLRRGQPTDVDNVCDPVFSVLIGEK